MTGYSDIRDWGDRAEYYDVLDCPVDVYADPPGPAFRPGRAAFSASDMAGLLYDCYAPVGMVVRGPKEGRVWLVVENPGGRIGLLMREAELDLDGTYRVIPGGLVIEPVKGGRAIEVKEPEYV